MGLKMRQTWRKGWFDWKLKKETIYVFESEMLWYHIRDWWTDDCIINMFNPFINESFVICKLKINIDFYMKRYLQDTK